MTGAELERLFTQAGAVGWGYTPYATLLPHMGEEAQHKADKLCPHARSVLTAAFSYYAGRQPGNLSLYARGQDYHRVLTARLGSLCAALKERYPTHSFWPGADHSPIPEVEAARLSGLGLMGRNGLLILPPYGSWLFLGTILTDLPLHLPIAEPSPGCLNCGKCVAVCPGRALSYTPFDAERCLSHLTQKKGDLSPGQAAAIARHPYAWGCDLCQLVCPYNAQALETALPEFRTDLKQQLTEDMVSGLSNRQFKERYGNCAFAWRGPGVIRRNLALQREDTEHPRFEEYCDE